MSNDDNNKKNLLSVNESFINENSCFLKESNEVVYCKICKVSIKSKSKNGLKPLKKHLCSKKHASNVCANEKILHPDLLTPEKFNTMLLQWCIDNRIPISRLGEERFTHIFTQLTGLSLYSVSTFSKTLVPKLYYEKVTEYKNIIQDKPFYIMLDESPDRMGRKLLNILIGILDENEAKKPFLINTIEIESTASEIIILHVNHTIQNLFVNPKSSLNFKLLLTDKASYCLKLGKPLKTIYANMLYVTCIFHGLHNLCETLRKKCFTLDLFIAKLKSITFKSVKNRKQFNDTTNLCLPKFPVLTRWGTWVEFARWLHQNLIFFNDFLQTEIAIDLRAIYNLHDFDNDLQLIEKYFKIPAIIKQLESKNLTVHEQVTLLREAKLLIKDDCILQRYNDIFDTNPELEYFEKFVAAKTTKKYYTYAPLSTCWVERSFSSLKLILTPQRNLSVTSLKELLALYFNE